MKFFVIIAILVSAQLVQAKTLHREQSLYRNIIVTEVGKKRCMKFSLRKDQNQSQSCQYTNRPEVLVFDYAKLAVAGIFASDNPKKILIIGLGGGTLVEAFHSLAPQAEITSVEIDQAVIKVAKEYFNLPMQKWHKIIAKDGRIFIKREKLKGNEYDLIILDAFNGEYIPEHLMTVEFLREVRAILSHQGIVISNTFSTSILKDFEAATYQAAFDSFYYIEGKQSGNRVILAAKNKLPPLLSLKAKSHIYQSHFKNMDVDIEYIWEALELNPEVLANSKILTDDYAPVNILKR